MKDSTVLSLCGVIVIALAFHSCTKENFSGTSGTFIDSRDNTEYAWVRIGEQIWMAENLAYLPAVDQIPQNPLVTDSYYSVYGYQGSSVIEAKATTNFSIYGVLYNWTAAMNACPAGWHLPTELEWTQLTDYLDGKGNAGGKLKEIGTTYWNSPNTDATNETGFRALPGGYRNQNLKFVSLGNLGYWWSATEYRDWSAYCRGMYYNYSDLSSIVDYKRNLLSVRCLKNK